MHSFLDERRSGRIGKDEDGDPITTRVVREGETHRVAPSKPKLNQHARIDRSRQVGTTARAATLIFAAVMDQDDGRLRSGLPYSISRTDQSGHVLRVGVGATAERPGHGVDYLHQARPPGLALMLGDGGDQARQILSAEQIDAVAENEQILICDLLTKRLVVLQSRLETIAHARAALKGTVEHETRRLAFAPEPRRLTSDRDRKMGDDERLAVLGRPVKKHQFAAACDGAYRVRGGTPWAWSSMLLLCH